MDQPVDEHTASDLVAIADARQLSATQCKVLARNVTGALRPNRDFFLWVLVNLLSVALLRQSRRKDFDPVASALEIVLAQNTERRALLARCCDGQDSVRVTGDGIAADVDGLKFEAGWARIEHALAFGEFFITGHDGAMYGSFREAVTALSAAPGAPGRNEAVSILSRRIAQWRRDHLPLGRYERHFSSLIGYLGGRPQAAQRQGLVSFDDDDIVAFWRQCVSAGERLMFRTAVERFRDFERLVAQLGAMRNLGMPADLDALAARVDLDAESGETWNDAEEDHAENRLLDALNSLPADPKALTGVERDALASLVTLLPFHKQRPGTVLRVLAFAPVQSGIANFLRRGGGGADIEVRVTCADAESYDDIAGWFQKLLAHLMTLLRIAVALRFGDSADGDAASALAETIAQGHADLKRLRRAGFDRPRAELAAIFAQTDGVLSDLSAVVREFTTEVDRFGRRHALKARFEKDKPVFIDILTCAYLAKQEAQPDA